MKRLLFALLLALPLSAAAQLNTNRLTDIGRNALYFEDYVVAIQYFNQVIKVRPYLTEPYFLRAYAKMNLEDYRGAISDCDKALAINPFLPKVYYCRGFAYKNIGELQKSCDDFYSALELEPNNISATHLLIENLLQMERYDEADKICTQSLKDYPRYSDTYLLRSQLSLSRADTAAAYADLDTAIIYNKNSDAAYAIRGMLHYMQKHTPLALADLDEAIRINSYRSEYFGNRAIVRMQADDFRGAAADFDASIQIDNSNALSYFNRALLRSEVGDENRALDDLDVCIALEPNNYNAYLQRAYVNLRLGNTAAAERDFSTIITRYPDFVPAYYGRSEARRLQGNSRGAELDRYDAGKIESEIRSGARKARSGSEQELSATPEGRAIVQNLNKQRKSRYASDIRGQIQYNDIDIEPLANFTVCPRGSASQSHDIALYNAALEEFNKAAGTDLTIGLAGGEMKAEALDSCFSSVERLSEKLAKKPGDEALLLKRAYCYALIGDYENALADYDRLVAGNAAGSLYYFMRGNARLRLIESEGRSERRDVPDGGYSLAVNDFMMAFSIDHNFVYAVYNAGYAYLLQKNFARATECFNTALAIYPEFAEAYYNRGLIYLFQGDKDRGRQDLSKAGELGLHQAYNVIRRYAY